MARDAQYATLIVRRAWWLMPLCRATCQVAAMAASLMPALAPRISSAAASVVAWGLRRGVITVARGSAPER